MPAGLEQLALANARTTEEDPAELRRFLDLVPDPRGRKGRRYPAHALLRAAAATVLTGARSLIAISEWITDAPQHVLGLLGFPACPLTGLRTVPHAATATRWTRPSAHTCGPEPRHRRHPNHHRNGRPCGPSPSTARPCEARAPRPRPRSSCWRRWTTTA
ncbi:transposase family protein [Streptomyces sp. 2R]|uniref:transposase family protein n=1 Tax=Streptomyces sp. 2R TaxID=1883452 RepID=UPI00211AB1A4|nr:transposase family protein [Streptomyces sp. 2R]